MEKKILFVNDDLGPRESIESIFLKTGYYIVSTAEDAFEALRKLQESVTPYDLIITDYNMPKMNGLEFSKAVREADEYQFVPILMLTTETDDKKKQMAREAQVTGWIQKPFKMDRFLKIVQKSINQI